MVGKNYQLVENGQCWPSIYQNSAGLPKERKKHQENDETEVAAIKNVPQITHFSKEGYK